MKAKLIFALTAIILVGCGAFRHVPPIRHVVRDTVNQTVYRHDTIRDIRHYHDTLIQRDSVFVEGQTVYREKLVMKLRTLHDTAIVHRIFRDTMYISKRDSVSVPVYVDRIQKVKYIPWHIRLLSGLGGLCCVAAIAWLLFLYLKRKS